MSQILLQGITMRLRRYDQNWICAITGPPGSGKTSCAIELAAQIDPTFTEKNIVFSAKEFLALLDSGNLKKGSAIVWEELGVGLNAREFMKTVNKVISYILQTFRYRNLAIIITVPYLAYVDKSARLLFHTMIETQAIHRKERLCITKWFNLQYNQKNDKIYAKYPIIIKDSRRVQLTRVKFQHAPKELWREYLKLKRTFNKQLLKKTIRSVNLVELAAQPKKEINEDDICQKVLRRPNKFKTRINTISEAKLRNKFGVSVRQAKKLKARLDDELGL